jgi:uncharacterized protein YeaC (DUF1315 family)
LFGPEADQNLIFATLIGHWMVFNTLAKKNQESC